MKNNTGNYSGKNKVLDNFINKNFLEKNDDGKTNYQEILDKNNIKEKSKEKKFYDFILKKITNIRMNILKKVNYDDFLNNIDYVNFILESSTLENKEEILYTLNRIQNVIKYNSDKILKKQSNYNPEDNIKDGNNENYLGQDL